MEDFSNVPGFYCIYACPIETAVANARTIAHKPSFQYIYSNINIAYSLRDYQAYSVRCQDSCHIIHNGNRCEHTLYKGIRLPGKHNVHSTVWRMIHLRYGGYTYGTANTPTVRRIHQDRTGLLAETEGHIDELPLSLEYKLHQL